MLGNILNQKIWIYQAILEDLKNILKILLQKSKILLSEI